MVVVGASGVGKTVAITYFIYNHYIEEGLDSLDCSYRREITVDKKSVFIDFFDTTSPEGIKSKEFS